MQRKNGWTLAERVGEAARIGIQRLLRWMAWNIEGSAMTCSPERLLRLNPVEHCYSQRSA
jgi:hypothetical protein